ncbi:GNAT family protein [Streptomyces sp. NPDC051098]|uniref:GNAT family N-acetyltransferase n=1 Tax=Streptomyces sp. NPDC051098 TaxID=3155411 RepID=UPI003432DA5A
MSMKNDGAVCGGWLVALAGAFQKVRLHDGVVGPSGTDVTGDGYCARLAIVRELVEASSGLVLRRWKAEDIGAVMTAFADPLMRGQSSEPVDSDQAAERWVKTHDDQWAAGSAYSFAVVDGSGLVLGQVCVGQVNRRHATGWVSYWTTATARGRGIGSLACCAVARWAFDDADLFRLELGHRLNNPASCGVARAAGFVIEGRQRQKLEYDGVRFDVELHARLATDSEPGS